LNGDGVIGTPSSGGSSGSSSGTSTVIESFGSTSLVEEGSNYLLRSDSGSSVALSYGGAVVVDGQLGSWTPIGAEQTATGYEVAFKVTGADQYTIWSTDSSGNYLSSAFVSESGSSAALQSFEPSFQQDLNGDGVIGQLDDVPHFIYQGVDSDGALLYDITWNDPGQHPLAVRVLVPDNPSTNYEHSFLYALPVEAGLTQSTWGSGLDTLEQLDVQNQYNATIIEPIFPIDPWIADNPTDPTIDYETFMSTLLPTWVDSNFSTTGAEDNLLIGFSKSGYGALDLLFKHPSVFAAAAAWDFPADMAASTAYGTDENFQDNYRLSGNFIDTWKAPFTMQDRIWISGYDVFQTDVTDFDALLTSHNVLHTLSSPTYDAHTWSGGWVSDAVAGLYELEQNLNGGGGNFMIAGSADRQLIGPSNASVIFQAGSTGTLTLEASTEFAGTVAGLALGNSLDLSDVAFAAGSTLGYAPNRGNTGGVLTVSDGAHTANIALLGQYAASSFVTATDGHGGTLIAEQLAQVVQTQLTLPHA
jgi:Tryptophan-rich Synechocystis species C-terminal domain/Putative esterase